MDAVDGPMPQTKFVLRKAFEVGLQPIVVINKIDRPSARPDEVLAMTQDLFLELATLDHQLDFEVLYTNAKAGTAGRDPRAPGTSMQPLFEAILASIPGPRADLDGGFQMLVTNIDYDDYRGRTAIGRISRGRYALGDGLVRIGRDGAGAARPIKSPQVFTFQGLPSRKTTSC